MFLVKKIIFILLLIFKSRLLEKDYDQDNFILPSSRHLKKKNTTQSK